MSAAVAALWARKRPAPDQDPPAADANKRPRQGGFTSLERYGFVSIDNYELFEVLGEGAEGVVRRGCDRRTGEMVAVKWIFGEGPGGHGRPNYRALAMETRCLFACRGHPAIIGMREVAADAETGDVHLVLELVDGGSTLKDSIWKHTSEDMVRARMRQLVGAAKKMHEVGFIHRDIKTENVLVCPSGDIKICTFGSATRQKAAGKLHEACRVGTLQYSSPEQLDGSRCYGPAVDMWALGCVMAELLGAVPLFQAETEPEMIDEVSELRDRMSFTGKMDMECTADLSEAGRELLADLLAFCPEKRLTAAEALEHPWLSVKSADSQLD